MEKKQTHIMYGLVSGVAMALLYLILYMTGVAFKPGMAYISYIPFLAGIILNAWAYSKANDSAVTFGNIFGSCFKASMVVTLVIVLWTVASMYIFPDMKDKAIEAARDAMAKKQNMTDEQINTALSITMKYWNPILIAGSLLGTLFYGAIFSLIGGAIAPKNAVRPVSDNF